MDKLDTPLDEVIAMEIGDGGGNGGAVRGSRPRKGGGPAPGGKVCFFSAKGTFVFLLFFLSGRTCPRNNPRGKSYVAHGSIHRTFGIIVASIHPPRSPPGPARRAYIVISLLPFTPQA